MNREIKFRAFDKEAKTMHQVIVIGLEDKHLIYGHNNFYKQKSFDKIELMQFTGLHDKNGKEIYEGDILKSSPYSIGAVLFRNGVFLSEENRDGEPFCYPAFHFSISEIIGNIHENPELMK